MARDTATHDPEVVFRNTWATGACTDGRLTQRASEGLKTVETNLILKLTGPLAGWKLLDNGSSLTGPSLDFELQGADDPTLNVNIYLAKSNKLRGTRHRDSQPPAHLADALRAVKSARVHTDGDSL